MSKFKIEVKPSKYGRGVFATEAIRKGQLIEDCPIIPLGRTEFDRVCHTKLESYVYEWKGPKQADDTDPGKYTGACVCLGYGSLYNHSFDPNATWEHCVKSQSIKFYAAKSIKAGEEITHSYNWPEHKYREDGIIVPDDYVF